jgi:hypothetical protein
VRRTKAAHAGTCEAAALVYRDLKSCSVEVTATLARRWRRRGAYRS